MMSRIDNLQTATLLLKALLLREFTGVMPWPHIMLQKVLLLREFTGVIAGVITWLHKILILWKSFVALHRVYEATPTLAVMQVFCVDYTTKMTPYFIILLAYI